MVLFPDIQKVQDQRWHMILEVGVGHHYWHKKMNSVEDPDHSAAVVGEDELLDWAAGLGAGRWRMVGSDS